MAGGVRGGRTLKAVDSGRIVGAGAAGDIMLGLTMDYDSIAKAGIDAGLWCRDRDRRHALHGKRACCVCRISISRIVRPMHAMPRGHGWLWRMVNRIEHGEGRPEDLDVLNSVADNIAGRTICALGDAAALPVKSFIKHFRAEFQHHIDHQQCIVPHYMYPM